MWWSCPYKDRAFSPKTGGRISVWTPGRGTRHPEAANTTSLSAWRKETGPGNWQPEGKLLPHTPLPHKPVENKEHSVCQNKQKCSVISTNYASTSTNPRQREQLVAVLPSGHVECCSWKTKRASPLKTIHLFMTQHSKARSRTRPQAWKRPHSRAALVIRQAEKDFKEKRNVLPNVTPEALVCVFLKLLFKNSTY